MKYQLSSALTVFVALGLGACGSNTGGEQAIVDEAAAYITAAEDSDDETTNDAASGLEDQEMDGLAEEESSAPDPTLADAEDVCDFAAHRARAIAAYDTDGDGRISAAEAAEAREDFADAIRDRPRLARLAHRVRRHAWHAVRWAFDENGDRMLDENERAALVDAFESRCQIRRERVLAEFDVNQDGELDPLERAAFRNARRGRIIARLQEILERYDANNDGQLDLTERQAWKQDKIAAFRARRAEIRALYDANGDGHLDEQEVAALKAAIRQGIADGTRLGQIAG